MMTPALLVLITAALAFYNAGTIWAHEVEIFRMWLLVPAERFRDVHRAHWRALPYWIFAPFGLWIVCTIGLIWYHPSGSPAWAIAGATVGPVLSAVLTGFLWGRWQAMLANDPRGPDSPLLRRIVATHWIRTALVTIGALCAFALAVWMFYS